MSYASRNPESIMGSPANLGKSWKAHHGTRRCHAKWLGSGTTSVRWLWDYSDSHESLLQILTCLRTSSQDARTVAKISTNIMTKHAYLQTTIISDKGPVFVSQVIKEFLGITLQHATTKHKQTTGMLKRTNFSIKKTLKMKVKEDPSGISLSTLQFFLKCKTFYHTSIGCKPSRVLHGRVPYDVLDLKMGISSKKAPMPISQIDQNFLNKLESFFKMSEWMPCKPISGKKHTTTRKQMLQNWKDRTTSMSQSSQQIIKEVEYLSQIFGQLVYTLFKWPYRTTITWPRQLECTKSKSFIAWDYDCSRLDNPYPTYKPRHKNGNLTLKPSYSTMIYKPEHIGVRIRKAYFWRQSGWTWHT